MCGCNYCENQANFCDFGNVNMCIDRIEDGEPVIEVEPPYVWSIPINYCPFCGRDLTKKVDE